MFLGNLKIVRKLLLAFAVLIAISSVSDAIVFSELRTIKSAAQNNDRTYDLSMDVQLVMRGMVEQQNAIRGYVIGGDPAFLETYRNSSDEIDGALDRFAANTAKPEQKQRALELKAAFATWRARYGDPPLALARDPAARPQAQALVSGKTLGDLRRRLDVISKTQDAVQNERVEQEMASIGRATTILLISAVVAVAAAAGIAWLLSRAVAAPLVQLTGVMRRLAGGDNAVIVPGAGRKDELGEMAGAVETFKQAAIEKLRVEGEAEDHRRRAEAERARNEAAQAEASRQLAAVVSALAAGLEKLAAGELTFRIDNELAADYEKLRSDFNGAMGQLQETMKVISGSTHGIRSGTDEISQAADDLSRRTEQQAASLEETAAALDQITATVRKTAEGANHAREVVAVAKSDAQHSGEVVRAAVAAMTEIEQSAKQISQIIGVIDEIAFQTNLLALNAGVEAARAGDAGRGFAVVASEVRALAQRSADAAKEIKTLISTSTNQVGQGVALVGQTGEVLSRIVVQVADIDTVVSEIAASAQEQATGLQQVNTAVNQMDQVTQQNAAMVEQSTAASHSLAQETEELGRLIGRFKVGEPTVVTPLRRPSAAPVPKPQVALKTVGYGAATALKSQPVAAADAWEEF
jgi:methyl-accepting chemotaxis protein